MMQHFSITGTSLNAGLAFLLFTFAALACSDIGIGPDDAVVHLQSSVEPERAGTVNPPIGTYEKGKEISVEAVDSNPDDSLQFLGWTGDTTASENPLTFTISRDMNLTANFGKPITNTITVSNSENLSTELSFGMHPDATSGFDTGLDRDLPPKPMPPGFDARFSIPDYGLAEDYRPIQTEETVWKLELQSAENDTVYLEWDFSTSDHLGSLTLTDDVSEPNFEINMKEETSYSVSGTVETVFYIISTR